LSKILEGQTQIWGGNVVKTDKCIGVSQILGTPKSMPMRAGVVGTMVELHCSEVSVQNPTERFVESI